MVPEGKSRLGLFYSYHQVFCHHANATFTAVVGASIFTSSSVLILSSYCLIKLHNDLLNVSILGIGGSLVFTGLVFCLLMTVRIYHHSEAVLKAVLNSPFAQTKYDQALWKSRRPLRISAGNLFQIETPNFLISLFDAIILQNICNLCLTFP